ncbi:hypothetical protein B296_00058432 [Ensete ventricosum]|uniref:Uncharacterized protein n=1 Tax=Ensete ventricosum TaxID=4639 RepID=A0A426X0I9_ENSVE|nr:hypothetical protein B296_00058432 [Ensete ventricosum]
MALEDEYGTLDRRDIHRNCCCRGIEGRTSSSMRCRWSGHRTRGRSSTRYFSTMFDLAGTSSDEGCNLITTVHYGTYVEDGNSRATVSGAQIFILLDVMTKG